MPIKTCLLQQIQNSSLREFTKSDEQQRLFEKEKEERNLISSYVDDDYLHARSEIWIPQVC